MTRQEYLAKLIRLYLDAPDTPPRPRRPDWAIAAQLYQADVPLEELAHAIRLATLRRRLSTDPLPQIHSLAYYRAVHQALTTDELDPPYIRYIQLRHRSILAKDETKSATTQPESRTL